MKQEYQKYKFCGVFLHRKRLFVCREEDNMGRGRIAVFPPKEIGQPVEPSKLGAELFSALRDFGCVASTIYAEEMTRKSKQLIEFFGERTVASFEKNKKEIAIKQDSTTGGVQLFDGSSGLPVLDMVGPTDMHLGSEVIKLLKLKMVYPDS